MDEEKKFCVECGALLPDDAEFCPECGWSVKYDENSVSPAQRAINSKKEMGTVPTFILIYGVIAVAFGLIGLICGIFVDNILDWALHLAEQVKESDPSAYQQMIDAINQLKSIPNYHILMILSPIPALVSGALAVYSGKLASGLVKWKTCYIACMIASIALLFTFNPVAIICAFIGFYMTYRVHSAKDLFSS